MNLLITPENITIALTTFLGSSALINLVVMIKIIRAMTKLEDKQRKEQT